MSRFFIAILVLGLLLGGATIAALDGGDRKPLDLPSGGAATSEDDEDAPEVISFYGAEYEADAFFWLLDRSGSMLGPDQSGEPMEVLKFELTEVLQQLTQRAEFGIISFATEYTVFPADGKPLRATIGNKQRAALWVDELRAEGWTCMPDPAAEIFVMANKSKRRHRVVIMVGDGVPLCMGLQNNESDLVLEAIAGANYKRIRVNTVFIASDVASQTLGIALYTEIAHRNRGKVIIVEQ